MIEIDLCIQGLFTVTVGKVFPLAEGKWPCTEVNRND